LESVRKHQQRFFSEPFISMALAPTFQEELEKEFPQPVNSEVGMVPRTNPPIYKHLPPIFQQQDVAFQKTQRAMAVTHRALVDLLTDVRAQPELRKKVSMVMKVNAAAYLQTTDLRRKGIQKALIQQNPPMATALKAGQITCEVYGPNLVKLSDAALVNTVLTTAQQEATLRSVLKSATNTGRGAAHGGTRGSGRSGGNGGGNNASNSNNRNRGPRTPKGQQNGGSDRQQSFLGDGRNKQFRQREQSDSRDNRDYRNNRDNRGHQSTPRRNNNRSN
jgi:hypothetical protein